MLTLQGVYVGIANPDDMAQVRDAGGTEGLRAGQDAPHNVASPT